MKKTEGRRRDLTADDIILEQSEYGQHYLSGAWYARPPHPDLGMGNLSAHTIIEHDDGTITVSPSILVSGHSGKGWHGYLECGIWREV